jgi:ribosomal protein S18 acetylase RimI-like enzyme
MHHHTKLRPAVQADALEIAELENQLFPETSWNELTLTSQIELGSSWVAEQDGRVIGYALIHRDNIIDLLRLGVDPPHRNKQVASTLLELSLGVSAAVLTVKRGNPAIKLYKRHGFKVAGVIGDAWVMRRAHMALDENLIPQLQA